MISYSGHTVGELISRRHVGVHGVTCLAAEVTALFPGRAQDVPHVAHCVSQNSMPGANQRPWRKAQARRDDIQELSSVYFWGCHPPQPCIQAITTLPPCSMVSHKPMWQLHGLSRAINRPSPAPYSTRNTRARCAIRKRLSLVKQRPYNPPCIDKAPSLRRLASPP